MGHLDSKTSIYETASHRKGLAFCSNFFSLLSLCYRRAVPIDIWIVKHPSTKPHPIGKVWFSCSNFFSLLSLCYRQRSLMYFYFNVIYQSKKVKRSPFISATFSCAIFNALSVTKCLPAGMLKVPIRNLFHAFIS